MMRNPLKLLPLASLDISMALKSSVRFKYSKKLITALSMELTDVSSLLAFFGFKSITFTSPVGFLSHPTNLLIPQIVSHLILSFVTHKLIKQFEMITICFNRIWSFPRIIQVLYKSLNWFYHFKVFI